jgi:hypothetical protein
MPSSGQCASSFLGHDAAVVRPVLSAGLVVRWPRCCLRQIKIMPSSGQCASSFLGHDAAVVRPVLSAGLVVRWPRCCLRSAGSPLRPRRSLVLIPAGSPRQPRCWSASMMLLFSWFSMPASSFISLDAAILGQFSAPASSFVGHDAAAVQLVLHVGLVVCRPRCCRRRCRRPLRLASSPVAHDAPVVRPVLHAGLVAGRSRCSRRPAGSPRRPRRRPVTMMLSSGGFVIGGG